MRRLKRGRIKERFAMIPLRILELRQFQSLRSTSKLVLFCVAGQYNGYQNGRLTFTQADGVRFGLPRSGTRCNALKELQHAGFILKTQQGGLRGSGPVGQEATMWALAWLPIQYRNGKQLDVAEPAPEAQKNWNYRCTLRHATSTESVPDDPDLRVQFAS